MKLRQITRHLIDSLRGAANTYALYGLATSRGAKVQFLLCYRIHWRSVRMWIRWGI